MDHPDSRAFCCEGEVWYARRGMPATLASFTQIIAGGHPMKSLLIVSLAVTVTCVASAQIGFLVAVLNFATVARDDRDVPLLTHNPLKGWPIQAETARGG